jgi:hypothetical protein
MKAKHILPLLALVVLCTSQHATAEKLRYKFTKDAVHANVMTMQMDMKMNVNGMDINVKMTQVADMKMTVTNVDSDGNASTVQQITRMKMSMQGAPGLSVEYDSASKDPPQGLAASMAPLFKALTENSFKGKLAPSGAILSVEIPKEFTDKLKSSPQAAILGNLFTEDGIKDLMRNSAMTLPDGDSAEGDEWSNSVSVKMPFGGEQVTRTTYTYRGPKMVDGKSLQQIDVMSKMTIEADDDAQVPITIKSHKGAGTILFDNQAGQLQSTTLTQTTVMQIDAGGQKIDQTVKVIVTVEQKPTSPK